ncbi:integrase [Aureimonas sp. SK2]|uniref:GPW/gp25 family protein n=1 Tax=Aureimonas sp. SK2 TaxID=3015992 RepID=UPI00244385C1|nr:integrase [Aureimonas sp. SK2]
MAAIVRYRTGIDRQTGKVLVGFDHVRQSLGVIWTTKVNRRLMLLDFGSSLRRFLAEDITPSLVMEIYDELVTSAHKWEPEYRISDLQLVHLKRTGGLGLAHGGTYYPEGRFGNYAIAENANTIYPLADRERLSRAVA